MGGADEDLGGVVGRIFAGEDTRAWGEMEGDAGLDFEGTGEQHPAGGHDHGAAAGGMGGVDRGLERGAVVGGAVEFGAVGFGRPGDLGGGEGPE